MSSVRKPNKEQEAVKQELQKWCKVIDQYRLQVDNTGVPEDIEEVVSFVLTPVPNTTIMVLSLSVYSDGQLKGVATRNQFRKLMNLVDRVMVMDVKQLYEYSEVITMKIHDKCCFRSLWGVQSDYWFINKHNCHRLFFLPKNSIGVLHDTLFSNNTLREMCKRAPGLNGVYINPSDIYYTRQEIIASIRHPIITP